MQWLRRIWYFLNHRAMARDLEREMAAHRAMLDDPRRFGSLLRLREESADVWGWTRVERLAQDVRYAVRLLRRRPVLSATAILTLMLGIGSTTAVFSLLDALHLRRIAVAEPDELVRLVEPRPDGSPVEAFTLITQDTLQRASKTLSGVAASSALIGRPDDIFVGAERRRAIVQFVSDNYFDVLGVQAAHGRVFHQPPPGSTREPIAVISDGYWRRQYDADTSILGTPFRRGTRQFTIAGIAPPSFLGTEVDVPVDIWVSLEHVYAPDDDDRVRGRWARVMGRLRPGVTSEEAQSEAAAILGRPVQFHTGGIGYSQLRHRLRQPLLLVALMVVLVLLIACGNLANLLLAATTSRDREIAMRGAIGASTSRIVGQLIVESLLLALLGGILGLVVAYWTSATLLAFLPPAQASALPNLRFAVDLRVLGFVIGLSLGTCLLFGALPAFRSARSRSATLIRAEGGAGRNRSVLSQGLVVSQVVMCTALLVVAGVFVRSVQNLRSQDGGYQENGLVVADVEFPREYGEPRRDQLIEELRTRAASLPAVDIAAFSHVGQLSGAALEYHIGFPGQNERDDDRTSIEQRISPGFLRTMGTRLIAGRDIVASDDERAPLVAIVNEGFARRFLPGRSPIGARFFRYTGTRAGQLMEIVGVVRDTKWVNLRDDAPPMYYRPYSQMGGSPSMRLAVRTSGDPDQLVRDLSRMAQSVDRQVTVGAVPFREIVNRTLVIERLIAQVSTAFSALALLIAAVGLYGVLAYSVARRRREIGVRIAVGAEPGTIEGMFLKESLTLAAVGVALGIPIAIVVTRLSASFLFGLSPQDPVSIGIALTALTITTITAAYLPARTAARIDPIHALRED